MKTGRSCIVIEMYSAINRCLSFRSRFNQLFKTGTVEDSPLAVYPHGRTARFIQQYLTLFPRKEEQRRGQSICQTGIPANNGNASPVPGGVSGLGVNDVVIQLSVNLIRPLVITAGHHTSTGNTDGLQVFAATIGVLNANDPGSSGDILWPGGAYIAAYTDQ